MSSRRVPSQAYFAGSAVFHYLGPAFAVLLFTRVAPLGVAWLRIVSAALVFAAWRRPWRVFRSADRATIRLLVALGAVLAAMNSCFYEAIARLPLGTVSAIEFLAVIALAAFGARSPRNVAALGLAVAGVYVLIDVRLRGGLLGFGFGFANAGLFALYIVLAHRVSRQSNAGGIDGLAVSMLLAVPAVSVLGGWQVVPHLLDPVALAAGVGVGVSSSVIPYVCDQLAMARLPRATYSLMVSLLPATATVVGLVVLGQTPSARQLLGISLVVAALALHRERRVGQTKNRLRAEESAPDIVVRYDSRAIGLRASAGPADRAAPLPALERGAGQGGRAYGRPAPAAARDPGPPGSGRPDDRRNRRLPGRASPQRGGASRPRGQGWPRPAKCRPCEQERRAGHPDASRGREARCARRGTCAGDLPPVPDDEDAVAPAGAGGWARPASRRAPPSSRRVG